MEWLSQLVAVGVVAAAGGFLGAGCGRAVSRAEIRARWRELLSLYTETRSILDMLARRQEIVARECDSHVASLASEKSKLEALLAEASRALRRETQEPR
jgi:hypothetical protein